MTAAAIEPTEGFLRWRYLAWSLAALAAMIGAIVCRQSVAPRLRPCGFEPAVDRHRLVHGLRARPDPARLSDWCAARSCGRPTPRTLFLMPTVSIVGGTSRAASSRRRSATRRCRGRIIGWVAAALVLVMLGTGYPGDRLPGRWSTSSSSGAAESRARHEADQRPDAEIFLRRGAARHHAGGDPDRDDAVSHGDLRGSHRFPGAAQHVAQRSGALQTRDVGNSSSAAIPDQRCTTACAWISASGNRSGLLHLRFHATRGLHRHPRSPTSAVQ